MAAEIAFSALLGFITGIATYGGGIKLSALILGSTVILISVFLLKRTVIPFIFIGAVFMFLGVFYFVFYNKLASANYPPFDKKLSLEAIIEEEPKTAGTMQRANIRFLPPYGGEIDMLANGDLSLNYGDKVKLDGLFRSGEGSYGPAFFANTIEVLSKGNGFWLKERLLEIKYSALAELKESLSPQSAALMGGLLLGARNDFSVPFKEAMKGSGTTHLVALSGYNISILVTALGFLLAKYFSRKVKFSTILVGIFLFTLMVGGDASVVRAGIMGALLLLSQETGRVYSPRHAIVWAAGMMAIFDPNLIFDLGFELSFISLLGIVYLLPAIKILFRKEKFSVWAEIAFTTIAAQVAVLPLAIRYFGSFSIASVIANSLLLPFVPLAMLLGAILVGSGLFSPLAFSLGFISEAVLRYFIFVIDLFSKVRLPFGDFLSAPYAPLIYYAILIIFIYANYPRTSV